MSSSPGVTSVPSRRQKRMGPAPFASFEDLSDELESPEDKAASVVRLPGIREDATPNTPSQQDDPPRFFCTGISLVGAAAAATKEKEPPQTQKESLLAPTTPRIDISRASSSSHHDSHDSSPERELFEGHDPAGAKLGLGFREEGTLDLRSSTEELDFQDPNVKSKPRTRPQSPSHLQDDSHLGHIRKDSQSSDIVLLSISGRTSRLSSIGSQGSAQSRLSNASHLSIVSGQSGLSRSPSPHKVLLETSFCGPKPTKREIAELEAKREGEALELMLLARQHDPTEAILAEGISMELKSPKGQEANCKTKKDNVQSVKSDILITVDKPPPSDSNNVCKLPRTYVSKSGVEYTYIPLKGPLPPSATNKTTTGTRKPREVKSATIQSTSNAKSKTKVKSKSATPSPVVSRTPIEGEPKYIRIKLKPDHMYDDDDSSSASRSEPQKPYSLNLIDANKKPPQTFSEIIQNEQIIEAVSPSLKAEPQVKGKSLTATPNASPKPSRHGFLKETGSKTPSPSLSRKSSFCSLFKSREAIISPESPTVPSSRRKHTIGGILRDASESLRDRSRSRSKSKEREKTTLSAAPSSSESIDSTKSRQKSVFSLFKPKKGEKKSDVESSPEVLPTLEGLANVEFKFKSEEHKKKHEKPLEGTSIRIPLHSPTHSERSMLQDLKTSSQDSQETVIEVKSVCVDVEPVPKSEITTPKIQDANRQSSTSSENVVFTTKLGSNNDIFSTKLPKKVAEETKTEKPICSTIQGYEDKPEDNWVDKVDFDSIAAIDTSNQKVMDNRTSVISSVGDEDRNSSESEKDSEADATRTKKDLFLHLDDKTDPNEVERKGLVFQQDSFEDELPYVPTTLPLERSVAVPIVPIKQRSTFEMKTCPIERPRSTTPINPSCLEEYCEEVIGSINVENITSTIEKLKISLPKDDTSDRHAKVKSPRKTTSNTTWFAFAEKKISPQRRSSQDTPEPSPPPLPPKGVQKEWINFEEIPERRKPPKRIQTIPSARGDEVQENVVYSYVNPEDCKCECHELGRERRQQQQQQQEKPQQETLQEDEMPLLEEEGGEEKDVSAEKARLEVATERRSLVSESSVDLSVNVDRNGTEMSLRTPFTSDLGLSSNRSSILSQEEPSSPEFGTSNAFSKS